MPYPPTAAGALLDSVVGLYMIVVILRLLFQLLRVEFHNPLVRLTLAATDPPLRLLRRLIPAARWRGIDPATAVFVWLLALVKVAAPHLLAGADLRWGGALIVSLADALDQVVWVFLIAVLARVVLSWVAPTSVHPAVRLVYQLSAPVLAPFQRILPTLGGLDFSPLAALFGLNLVQRWLVSPLADFGFRLL